MGDRNSVSNQLTVIGLTRVLAVSWARRNIRVNTVAAATTRTPTTNKFSITKVSKTTRAHARWATREFPVISMGWFFFSQVVHQAGISAITRFLVFMAAGQLRGQPVRRAPAGPFAPAMSFGRLAANDIARRARQKLKSEDPASAGSPTLHGPKCIAPTVNCPSSRMKQPIVDGGGALLQ